MGIPDCLLLKRARYGPSSTAGRRPMSHPIVCSQTRSLTPRIPNKQTSLPPMGPPSTILAALMDFRTQEGHLKGIIFKNANVSFPILSTGRIADNNNKVWYDRNGGDIVNLDSGETSRFIRAMGVYWIKMILPEHEGFGRHG